MISIEYERVIKARKDQIFTKLLDHANLDTLFNAQFNVLTPALPTEPSGGKGCVREVTILGISFLEQITHATSEVIEYQVLNDFPVSDHLGKFTLNENTDGTKVTYHICCKAPWYLPNLILKHIIKSDILRCLNRLEAFYDPR